MDEGEYTIPENLLDVSVEDLRQELESRRDADAKALRPPSSDKFSEFAEEELVSALRSKQKLIYGVDDREDIFRLVDPADRRDADSVVALFRATAVSDNGDGTSTLATTNFGTARNLCASEAFRSQPIGAFCSGFLVA